MNIQPNSMDHDPYHPYPNVNNEINCSIFNFTAEIYHFLTENNFCTSMERVGKVLRSWRVEKDVWNDPFIEFEENIEVKELSRHASVSYIKLIDERPVSDGRLHYQFQQICLFNNPNAYITILSKSDYEYLVTHLQADNLAEEKIFLLKSYVR